MEKIKSLLHSFRYSAKFWLALAVIFCGLWAFGGQYIAQINESGSSTSPHSFDEILYKTIQLFILQTGVEQEFNSTALRLARVFAAILFITMSYSLLNKVFQESFDSFRLQFLNQHTIVCGLGETGLQIVEDLLSKQRANRKWFHLSELTWPRVVIVESNLSKATVAKYRSRGGLVVIGDATNEELLESVGVRKAKRLVITTGSDEANAEIVFDCINLMRSAKVNRQFAHRLECFVKITDPTVFQVFSGRAVRHVPGLPIDLRVFNPAALRARRMIERDFIDWRPTSSEEVGLFVMIGFGKIGQAIALQIAELAHFENRKRQRFLIFEENVQKVASRFTAQFETFTHDDPHWSSCKGVPFSPKADHWNSRYRRASEGEQVPEPGVEYVCNARFVEAPRHYSERGFVETLHRVLSDEGVKPVVLVCRDKDRENFDISGLIADALEHRLDKFLPIYAWLPQQKALRSVLEFELESPEESESKNYFIKPISMEDLTLDTLVDSDVEKNAERLHNDYQKKYCSDKSGACADWPQLSETFRQSNRSAAIHASMKQRVLESLGINPETDAISDDLSNVLAEMEHNRWMSERLLAGWRYSPEKDNANMLRPSIQPWETLPDEERVKDSSQVKKVVKIVKRKAVIKSTKDKFSNWKKSHSIFGERRMNSKKIAVAMVRDDEGKFLLIHNKEWGGYNFPMTQLDESRPPLGSKAIEALESETGARLQKATAHELEYLGQYGISDRTGEDAVYEYWLYEVDPGESLEISDAVSTKKLSLEEVVELADGTWSTHAIANELLNNREVAVAVVSRLGKEQTEYLVIKNDNYGGYFFPSMRRKTETSPESVTEKLFRDDFAYTGEIESQWKAEVEDVHFSQRFQADTQFRFHICNVTFPALDIHMPFNALERKLRDRGVEFKWVTADELGTGEEFSKTTTSLKNQLLASIPSETREESLPGSEGGIALITKEVKGETHYLAQWNDKWKAFFFVGGHREGGESFRDCVIREVCEELELQEDDFRVSAQRIRSLEYQSVSKRTRTLTSYKHEVFEVDIYKTLLPDSKNLWLTRSDILSGGANDGRAISNTTSMLLTFAQMHLN